MSDRLKFRVWDNVEKKYLNCDDDYIDYAITRDGILILIANDNSDCRHIYLDKNRYIIEQCTDVKDKNGKLIYEGDIVHYVKHTNFGLGGERYAKVFWWEDAQGFAIKTIYGDYYDLTDFEIEVVGNIHENSEWLNADKA